MKNLITIKAVQIGIGIGIGNIIYDYFSDGIDWKRSLFITVFTIIGLSVYFKNKKA